MEITQQAFNALEKRVGNMESTLNEVHFALIGNRLAGDGGLVKRVSNTEAELVNIKTEIRGIKDKAIKSNTYLYIVWAAAGFIASAIFLRVLELALTKK